MKSYAISCFSALFCLHVNHSCIQHIHEYMLSTHWTNNSLSSYETVHIPVLVFKTPSFYLITAPNHNDIYNSYFLTGYYYSWLALLLVTVVNVLLCQIYKSNFITGIYA
jgi:hypothetical protein